jgi:hypothetical protein
MTLTQSLEEKPMSRILKILTIRSAANLRHKSKTPRASSNDEHRINQHRIGQSIIELASIIVCMVPLILLALNLSLLTLAAAVNDHACRDAARAAAQTKDYTNGLSAARAIVSSYPSNSFILTKPAVVTSGFIYEDYGGNPPDNESPYVSVTTETTVKVPAPIFFFGAQFNKNGYLKLNRTYLFPIVKSELYLP